MNPYIRAFAASAYISLIGLFFMYVAPSLGNIEKTPLAPILMLSLLVFSVTVMGYLFFFEPLALFLDGKRTEALREFFTTVVTFAFVTAAVFVIAFVM